MIWVISSCFCFARAPEKKLPKYLKLRIWKKGSTIIHEKYLFLLDIDFLVKEITKPVSNFTWRKVCFLSVKSCQVFWGFWSYRRLQGYSNRSLFWYFVHTYSTVTDECDQGKVYLSYRDLVDIMHFTCLKIEGEWTIWILRKKRSFTTGWSWKSKSF
jgi:hypothetical protein